METGKSKLLQEKGDPYLIKKIIISFVGFYFVAQGVSFYIMMGIGIDPISVFVEGLSKQIHCSFGMSQFILNVLMITLAYFFAREQIGPSTIVSLFMLGIYFDLIMNLQGGYINSELDILYKIFFAIIGQLLFSFGVALYLSVQYGASPGDIVGVALSERKKWHYRWTRMGMDAAYAALGFLLGGTLGMGTLIAVTCTGPLAQLFRPYCNKITTRLTKNRNKF